MERGCCKVITKLMGQKRQYDTSTIFKCGNKQFKGIECGTKCRCNLFSVLSAKIIML